MFGRRSKHDSTVRPAPTPIVPAPNRFAVDKAVEASELEKTITQIIADEKDKLLANPERNKALHEEEHERQLAGFSFECRRHGDFLTIYLTRLANRETDTHHTVTLNLGLTKALRLTEGRGPDMKGGATLSISGYKRGLGKPKIRLHSYLPKFRLFESPRPMSTSSLNWKMGTSYGDDWEHEFKDLGLSRPAEDDMISFGGIDTYLYAPAGMGEALLDAILAEIGRGCPPVTIKVNQS